MSLVWIAPTQFVKSSKLSQVVVADKHGLASVGPNRLMGIYERWVSEIGTKLQQLVMYGAAN